MTRKSFFTRLFSILSVFVLVLGMGIGFSTFVVDGYDESETVENTTQPVRDGSPMCTVGFKYVYLEEEYVWSEWQDLEGYTNISFSKTSDSTYYDKLDKFIDTYCGSNSLDENGVETGLKVDNNGKYLSKVWFVSVGDYYPVQKDDSTIQYHVSVSIQVKKYWKTSKYLYDGAYSIQKRTRTVGLKSTPSNSIDSQLSIKNGTKLSDCDLYSVFSNAVTADCQEPTFAGLKTSLDGDYVDLTSTTISSNTEYYAFFYDRQKNYPLNSVHSITKVMNDSANDSSANSYNYSLKNSSSSLAVSKDFTYDANQKAIYLGDANTPVTIGSGDTFCFCIAEGTEYEAFNSSSNIIEPQESNRLYTIKLGNDLVLNGALTLGSQCGRNGSGQPQGNISGKFVTLDLNGHDITIKSGGSLWGYGVIIDSIGTGHIYVNGGGKVYSLLTVLDYRGGTATTNAAINNQMPFESYNLPYLRARVVLKFSNGTWGEILAICRMYVGSKEIPIIGLVEKKIEDNFNFIGPDTGTYLFKCKTSGATENSTLTLDGNTTTELNDTSAHNLCLDRRFSLTLSNMTMVMGALNFEVDAIITTATVDSSKYNFPVNSFLDVRVTNKSTIEFSQRLQFMTGASFLVDKTSTVVFTYDSKNSKNKHSAQISSLDRMPYYYDNEYGSIDKDNLSGLTFSLNPLLTNTSFWKYYSQPKIKIYGNLVFEAGNGSSLPYILAGPIDFVEGNIGVMDSSGNIVYFRDTTSYPSPFAFVKANGASVRTYALHLLHGMPHDSDTYLQQYFKGYARPLVSNGKAYCSDDVQELVGTFDFYEGIFRSDDNEYYFNTSYDSSGNALSFSIDDSYGAFNSYITIKNCSYDESTHIITDADTNKQYIYFSSMAGEIVTTTTTADDGTTTTTQNVSFPLIKSGGDTQLFSKYKFDKGRWLRA